MRAPYRGDLVHGRQRKLRVIGNVQNRKVVLEERPGQAGERDTNEQELAQVMVNLIINACHAVDGKGRIDITTLKNDQDLILIQVKDNGKGIAQENLSKIFDPFFTTRAEGEGTGLGLHLSRRIAQECGGELRYEPRPGGGARFVMEIPAMEQAA